MGKTPCCSKVGLRKGSWSTEEDMLLTEYIQAHGEGQWRSLPKKAGLLRCGKSCRLRWKNYLCPGIKRGNITPDEEDLIIRLHSLLGNRWTLIAGRLPNRTDNEIKNHWNTHLIKRLKNAGIEPKSNNNLAKMPKESKKPTRAGAESNNSNAKKKRKNYSSNDSNSMAADKIKIYVPKPIRVLPGFSSSNTIDSSLTSTSRNEEVNQEAIVKVSHFDAEPKAEVSHFTWPLNELGDANLRAVEVDENDQVLINGCNFSLQKFLFEEVSLQDSVPTISDMLEKAYDEYLQLL